MFKIRNNHTPFEIKKQKKRTTQCSTWKNTYYQTVFEHLKKSLTWRITNDLRLEQSYTLQSLKTTKKRTMQCGTKENTYYSTVFAHSATLITCDITKVLNLEHSRPL
ncbi:hypothetical protein HanRHA438_Chr05g0241011 [Helianthus annuus]|nr:hypothetical protein HanHA89_Chr05g0204571 [Helianthus annuus]KAJ0920411.1 hypothetical protein HanRHA438_Chr05g0241011 [Helianthus annuus]